MSANGFLVRRFSARLLCAGLSLWLFHAQAAPATTPGLAARYPAGSIQSLETADQALADSAAERAAIAASYAADEAACFPKFFATACLDRAKERRRLALSRVRPIEIEAKSFKRRDRVAEREKALAAQRAKDESDAPKRIQVQRARDTTPTAKAAPSAAQAAADASAAALRIAQHELKIKQLQKEEAEGAGKRAENVAAYEKKVRDAESHRRELEIRKAEKERDKNRPPASAQ